MMFFIESVTTYSTSGKTRKGAAIQAAASKFEHNLLSDGTALSALVSQLRILVKVCNDNFRGSELFLTWHRDNNSGQISIGPRATGYESPVASIHYAPIEDRIAAINIRDRISQALQDNAPDIYPKYSIAATKGGTE